MHCLSCCCFLVAWQWISVILLSQLCVLDAMERLATPSKQISIDRSHSLYRSALLVLVHQWNWEACYWRNTLDSNMFFPMYWRCLRAMKQPQINSLSHFTLLGIMALESHTSLSYSLKLSSMIHNTVVASLSSQGPTFKEPTMLQ